MSVEALMNIRAKGNLSLVLGEGGIVDMAEGGGYRLKFPHNEELREVVLVNTAGGLVGGDSLDIDFDLRENAALLVSTTGSEKIYDAKGLLSRLNITLKCGVNSALYWLPQETILYNGANFKRQFDVAITGSTTLLLAEMLIFGRLASNEVIREASFHDRWRITRDEKLIYADNIVFEGAMHEKLDEGAIGHGARTTATIIFQGENHEALIEDLREKHYEGVELAFTLKSGLLIARFLSSEPHKLRLSFSEILGTLMPHKLPRNW